MTTVVSQVFLGVHLTVQSEPMFLEYVSGAQIVELPVHVLTVSLLLH